jgi:hypothetical protein
MAMAKSPTDRPASAEAFGRALQAIEQDLHLPVTPMLLTDDEPSTYLPPKRAADETHVRVPRTVEAQPVSEPRRDTADATQHRRWQTGPPVDAGPVDHADARAVEGSTHRRRAHVLHTPEPPVEGTIRRGRRPPGDGEPLPTATGSAPRPRRWRLIVALTVVAVVAVAAGGVLALSGGQKEASTLTSGGVGGSVQAQNVFAGQGPGTPVLHAVGMRGYVEFRWTYAEREASDTFRWSESGTGKARQGVALQPSLSVRAPKGTAVCLAVQVVRRDGSALSNLSDPLCASAS